MNNFLRKATFAEDAAKDSSLNNKEHTKEFSLSGETLQDMLVAALAENERLAAVEEVRLQSMRREFRNTWGSRMYEILTAADSLSSILRLPFALYSLWREARTRSSKALGGESFSAAAAAHAEGGLAAVQALYAKTALSPFVKAQGYTVLARRLQTSDPRQACEAARLAYEADPQPYRRKWLAFRLYEAGDALGADALLQSLADCQTLSPTEFFQARKIAEVAAGERLFSIQLKISPLLEAASAPARPPANRPALLDAPSLALEPSASVAGKPRVAAVMDRLSHHVFSPECELLQLHPQTFEEQLRQFVPDFLLIKSAWQGADGHWQGQIATCSDAYVKMMETAREMGVPTVFWNTEDPLRYDAFLPAAREADYVFTTETDCIPHYKRDLGHDRIFLLPFAAQPVWHNPLEKYERKHAFSFAGSGCRQSPERLRDFDRLAGVATRRMSLDIYDRCPGSGLPQDAFPKKYASMVLGAISADEMDAAYKGYRYALVLNAVKYSQTVFAPEIFALLASNTLTLSNYSHAARLFFGDLLLCSDSEQELERQLAVLLEEPVRERKLRLLGLRNVMSRHTCRHRLDAILQRLGLPPPDRNVPVAIFASAKDAGQAAAVMASFSRQSHAPKHLVLQTPELPAGGVTGGGDLTVVQSAEEAFNVMRAFDRRTLFGVFSARDVYFPAFLTDLQLAFTYSRADCCGKGSYYAAADAGLPVLQNDGTQYTVIAEVPARASLSRLAAIPDALLRDCLSRPDTWVFNFSTALSTDEFNYVRDGAGLEETGLDLAADLSLSDQGMASADLAAASEAISRSIETITPDVLSQKRVYIAAAEIFDNLSENQETPSLRWLRRKDTVVMESKLSEDEGKSVFLSKTFTRAEINLLENRDFSLLGEGDQGALKTVIEYMDSGGNAISRALLPAGTPHTLTVPEQCARVRLGFRIEGPGTFLLKGLVFATRFRSFQGLVCPTPYLVVTKQYPQYDDLYRYGFLHARIRAYKRHGLHVSVFMLRETPATPPYHEFEGIEVAAGNGQQLAATLQTGVVKHVLVHCLDETMWEALRPYLDRLRVTVWSHGAEIQPWSRRAYDFEGLHPEIVSKRKSACDARMEFWKKVHAAPHPNLTFIFVSRTFIAEVFDDLGLPVPRDGVKAIPNFIDGDLFAYTKKTAEDRLRILSIRSFASRTYANDLTVRAILELSRRPFFNELSFRLIGDGRLFEETVAPLHHFSNVTLERRFLTHAEIAALQVNFGVFLIPTRRDSQGVSRDEAMAGGLVPITTNIAAVPEFVDDSCAILTPPEDPVALADAVEKLYHEPELFLRLSQAASERVRRQSGFEQTIKKEMEIIRQTSGAVPKASDFSPMEKDP